MKIPQIRVHLCMTYNHAHGYCLITVFTCQAHFRHSVHIWEKVIHKFKKSINSEVYDFLGIAETTGTVSMPRQPQLGRLRGKLAAIASTQLKKWWLH